MSRGRGGYRIAERITVDNRNQITLKLEGSRAERGVSLSNFERFIDSFLAALRDFDRDRRGTPTRKTGQPERQATAVTAFTLIRFEPGSGIATLEPEPLTADDTETLPLHEEIPPAVENLRALVEAVETHTAVSEPVAEALGKACRAFGQDGSIEIHFPKHLRDQPGAIDIPRLERLERAQRPADEEVRTVSGRLHLLDIEPDKLAIRTATGVDWLCKYPEELEPAVKRLVDCVVWVEGSGRKLSPQRGAMVIERIEAVEQGDQTVLFTYEQIPDADLLDRQGVTGPQGLDALVDPEWDETTDDAYLAALTGDALEAC